MQCMIAKTKNLYSHTPNGFWNRKKGVWQVKPNASCIYPTMRGAERIMLDFKRPLWRGLDDSDALLIAKVESK